MQELSFLLDLVYFRAINKQRKSIRLFLKLLVKHSPVSMKVLQRLTNIVRTSNDRIMDLTTLKAVPRVCRELMRLTKPDAAVAELLVIRPILSHNEIASRASTTRERVARVLGQLATRGIVERKNKALYIRDIDRLEKLASGADGDVGGT